MTAIAARLRSSLLCSLFLLATLATALKFDIEAGKPQRCIRNFVAKDTLVVVTATVGGSRGDGMMVNMQVKDALGNEYGRPRDVAGEQRILFTAHDSSAFDVCFENVFTGGSYHPSPLFPTISAYEFGPI